MGKSKDIRKHVEGSRRQIQKHLKKIADELAKPYPSRRDIAKWHADIDRHLRRIEQLEQSSPGRK